MRVGLDTSPLVQTAAGTARYLRGLVEHNDYVRLAFHGRDRIATIDRDAVWYPLVLPRQAGGASRRPALPDLPRSVRPPSCPWSSPFTDLAVLRAPGDLQPVDAAIQPPVCLWVARAARLVIAVSEHTKRDVVELLGTREERIRVVPNGVDPIFTPDGPAGSGDYVLAVGTLEPRKNLPRWPSRRRPLGVECASPGRRAGDRSSSAAAWLGRVSDEELVRLYRGARCLAYPSLYEGFGIPIVEAMASGTPVVTSRGGATEEVAGGAAVLVDPRDPAAIAAGIEEAAARRQELVRAGLERARAFTLGGATAADAPTCTARRPRDRRSSSSTPTCSAGSGRATRRTSKTCSGGCPGWPATSASRP